MTDDLDGLVAHDREWFSWQGVNDIKKRCRERAEAEGLDPLKAHFRAAALFDQCLQAKPTYRERQAALRSRCKAAVDPLRQALIQIRDGHNDPRSLAARVLRDN